MDLGINWDSVEENIVLIILFTIIFSIAITIVKWGIIWFFIKSAVKTGVKQALEETTVSASVDNVANGIVVDTRDVTPQQQYYYNGQQYNGNWTQG